MAAEHGTPNAVEKDDLVLPLIDFSTFLHGDPSTKLSTARSISNAFKTSGFLYLTHYGIPASKISAVFSESAAFFARPQSQKDALSWTTPQSNRGYVAAGREKVTQSSDPTEIAKLRATNPDIKESMEIGREGVPAFPNQWPDQLDADGARFTSTMKAFFLTCKELHVQVMRAIALGMGLGEHFFDPYTDGGDNNLRLLHYPRVAKSVFRNNPAQVRAGEHSDYGSITLLFQDNIGGLEVRSPKGTFVRAKPVEGAVVVNAGDLLARWSNDQIKSTRHRVVQPPEAETEVSGAANGHQNGEEIYPERYSIAYFCNPNFDKWIEALPGTWDEGGVAKKYPGINSGEYLVQRLAATY